MKVSNEFIMREIAGEFMIVPVGNAAARFNGLITVNELGSFLFHALETEQTEDSLLQKVLDEYEVDSETARKDLQEFLQKLREIHALTEQ